MRLLYKSLSLFLLSLLIGTCALADMPPLRGYDVSKPTGEKYLYVTFGEYFSDGYGKIAPVLWKVLGPGVPAAEDVSTIIADNDNATKKANEDVITEENADVYCLMTEYIIDFHRYNEVRDTRDGPPLEYKDSELFRFCNETSLERDENGQPIGMLGWLFTPSEREVLVYMPDRGYVSPPSRRGELFRSDYGFINEDFREWLPRQATGTYYAFDQGLKYIVDNWSWYWTTDRRRVGFRWIVGDNGHTSVAGAEREGGVRIVCYAHMDQLECIGGSGTKEDPYQLVTMSDFFLDQKKDSAVSGHAALSAELKSVIHTVSNTHAQAQAREAEAIRLAAQAQAEEEARIARMMHDAQTGMVQAHLQAERNAISAQRALDSLYAELLHKILLEENASSDAAATFEASPSGMVFMPAQ